MIHFLQRLSQAFLHAIFPPKCLICSSYYAWQPSAGKLGSDLISDSTAPYFCESCRTGLIPIASPFCSKCGLPFVSREGDSHTCYECLLELQKRAHSPSRQSGTAGLASESKNDKIPYSRRFPVPLERDCRELQKKHFRMARAFGVYDGSLMEAIHLLKYGKKTFLSRPLSILARKTFFQFWDVDAIDLLVPVPLHIKRLRERGFNQAHLLIRRWAKQEHIPCDGLTLFRTRWTEPQTTLSRTDRQKNIKGAFSLRRPENIKGHRILLVDDVYTTGATVNECARVLMEAGAEFVDVLTLARAV
ncbi:MAG: hypothetical protein DRH17_12025 [Deltaproteobacteria bacterium]|nr:MAG: hypothetical protein DRH17_12025 [Deltaproteobacteria bacterium]